MIRPQLSVAALGFAVVLALSGCMQSRYHYAAPDKNAASGSFVSESGEFTTDARTYPAEFGTITVEENPKKPGSRLIHLPVMRIRSISKQPSEPIFGLTGGPGISNMKWTPPDSLLADHDFVMVGYRGVDGSSMLRCPEVAAALTGDADVLADESLRRIAEAWGKSAERLRQSGVDLDGYTIDNVVEDLELVRRQFRYERVDLLSESYGTRVAYIYGLMHPECIHRSVMIGVNPPGHFVWDPQTVDAQLQYYGKLWSEEPQRSKRSADLVGSMRSVLRDMPQKWLFFTINPGKVKIVSFALLFNRTTAPLVFDAFLAAEEGDASGLAVMSLAYDFTVPGQFMWGDLASKAVSADFDSSRNYSKEMVPSDAVLGSPLGKLLWGPLGHARWPVAPMPERLRTLQPCEVPTLLLSGTVDFSTPPGFATNELLPYLPNGRQILLSELGHVSDIWKVRPASTVRLLTSFFRTGIPDTSLSAPVPMDFEVNWGFPTIAKLIIGGGVAIIILLVIGTLWWIRR